MQEERSKEKQLVPSGSRGSFLGIVVCEWVARNARQLRAQTGKGCAWHRLLLRWSGAGRSPVAASRGAAGGSTSRQRAWEQLHSGAHRLGGGMPTQLAAPARKARGFGPSCLFIQLQAGSRCSRAGKVFCYPPLSQQDRHRAAAVSVIPPASGTLAPRHVGKSQSRLSFGSQRS